MGIPAYISIILNHKIKIAGDFAHIFNKLSKLGLEMSIDDSQYCTFYYNSTNTNIFDDIGLIETLLNLRDLGLIFGEDYKQLYSPAEYMRELIRRGYKIGDFQSIGFPDVNTLVVSTYSNGLLVHQEKICSNIF